MTNPTGVSPAKRGKLILAMVFELVQTAQKSWRKLQGTPRIGQLIEGVEFQDGEPIQTPEKNAAA